MFEKEAEEILNIHCDCELLPECMAGIRCRCSDFEESKKLLIEGIEFGYNKGNEWHYIKDGNLPKENENVLIYSNRANHIGFYRNGFWFTNSDGCLEDDDIEVIAWKEIVLPKEIEQI